MGYTIELPFPPSVNGYFATVRGRQILSKKGRDYQKAVMMAVLIAGRPQTFAGRLAVDVLLMPPDLRRRDVDNPIKALLDSLTKASVYHDDSQVDDLRVRRGKVTKPGKAVITITELD
jgi:crossover junction endodeoxyribonuclease RusA